MLCEVPGLLRYRPNAVEKELADHTMTLHYFSTRGTIDTVDETMVLHYTPVIAWIL